MSGTGEYGVSAPAKEFYKIFNDATQMHGFFNELRDSFRPGMLLRIEDKTKFTSKFHKDVNNWGLAYYSEMKIVMRKPYIGVALHEFAHLLSYVESRQTGHGDHFKMTLASLWDWYLFEKDNYSDLTLDKRAYWNFISPKAQRAGMLVDCLDEVVLWNSKTARPQAKVRIIYFVNNERVYVELIKSFHTATIRGNVGDRYFVNLSDLDILESHVEQILKLSDLTEEQLSILQAASKGK